MTSKKQRFASLLCLLLLGILPAMAQTFSEQKLKYPVNADGNQCVVSGFTPFSGSDEDIYAHTLLWAVENLCQRERDGIAEVNIPAKSVSFDLTLSSQPDSKQKNTYSCKAKLQVKDGKLVYHLSGINIQSSVLVMKRVTPMEKLQPEKKESHKEIIDDFVEVESSVLNQLFDFVSTHPLASPVTHWNEIAISKPVVGMTTDECLMAFGKPQTVSESGGEVQWMYNSSFYLFFTDGKVKTIIK